MSTDYDGAKSNADQLEWMFSHEPHTHYLRAGRDIDWVGILRSDVRKSGIQNKLNILDFFSPKSIFKIWVEDNFGL